MGTDTGTTIKWMPVYQPPPFDVQKRIEQLRGCLDPNNPCYERKEQHTNIKAVIKLYEDGKIDGVHEVCIMDGKIVPRKEIYTGKAWGWLEGIRHQFALRQTYGHGPFGLNAHEIRMLLRLTPALGGDGTTIGIIAMNDTGSDILTLFTTDLLALGNTQAYQGGLGELVSWMRPA